MGLFNFLYKLTNIFSNKRKLKVFLILVIILIIGFCWSRGVFASTPEDDEAILSYQLALQQSAIAYMKFIYEHKAPGYDSNAFTNTLKRMRDYQMYVVVPTGDPNTSYWIYFYNAVSNSNNPNLFTTSGSYSVGLNSGTQINCMLGDIACSYVARLVQPYQNRVTPVLISGSSVLMPSACYCVRSVSVNDFLEEMGVYSRISSTYKTSDSELQAINRNGFNNLNNTLNSQTQTMTNSINDASTSITNSVDNLNNTISDTTTDDSQVELAQDNNQDLTNGFFTGLYNSIEDSFTDNSYKFVQFPIPFTNKKITFSSSYVLNNIKRNAKFSVLVSLAESAWWFGLGYFVLLDIYKKINAIKSGDLTNIENENITTNLL